MSGLLINDFGHGTLASKTGLHSLDKNGIYEVVVSTPLNYKEGYAVFIRNQEDKVKAYELKEIPPLVFKVMEDDEGKLVYKAYP